MDDVERTLPASERRRAWAREQGYSARSAAFTAAVTLAAAASLWLSTGPAVIDQLASRLRSRFETRPALSLDLNAATELLLGDFMAFGLFAGWAMASLWACAAVANLIQTGFQWSPGAITPNASQINPVQGMGRLFSVSQVMTVVWSIVVLAAMSFGGGVAFRSWGFGDAWSGRVETVVRRTSHELAMLALQLAGVLAALYLLDVARRRWALEKSLRMSAEEQREEAGRAPMRARPRPLETRYST